MPRTPSQLLAGRVENMTPERRERIREQERKRSLVRRENAAYREYHREYSRKNDLLRKRGVTVERFEEMLREQGGRCAICSTDNPGKNRSRFMVDHCHSTGKVRGLLCLLCNWHLGRFSDDASQVRAASPAAFSGHREEAALYLEEHRY
jgi:hypothetical protein